jgi:hypothetical protein
MRRPPRRCWCEADESAGAGRLVGGFHAVRAAQREVHDGALRGSRHAPCRLGRHRGLDELCDGKRNRRLEQRLAREDDAPLGHGADLTGEAQTLESGRLPVRPAENRPKTRVSSAVTRKSDR